MKQLDTGLRNIDDGLKQKARKAKATIAATKSKVNSWNKTARPSTEKNNKKHQFSKLGGGRLTNESAVELEQEQK